MLRIYEMVANDFLYADPYNLVTFGDNHDTDRMATSLENNPALIKIALTFLATMRGIPQIYYGTEIMMENNIAPKDHGIIRTDFPGGWAGDSINAFTGEGLTLQQKDLQEYIKKLLNWRKTSKPVHSGKLMHFVPEKGVYVYFRYTLNEMLMVVLSKNDETKTIAVSRFDEMLQGERVGTDVFSGKGVDLSDGLSLEPNSALILEVKRTP
ncbi:MAG: cyclomaltodextrinase C-terminal domain-containing protein [Calditrichota bacterium]